MEPIILVIVFKDYGQKKIIIINPIHMKIMDKIRDMTKIKKTEVRVMMRMRMIIKDTKIRGMTKTTTKDMTKITIKATIKTKIKDMIKTKGTIKTRTKGKIKLQMATPY